VTFQLGLSAKFPLREAFALIQRQGYQRLLLENEVVRIDEVLDRVQTLNPPELTVIQDRLTVAGFDDVAVEIKHDGLRVVMTWSWRRTCQSCSGRKCLSDG